MGEKDDIGLMPYHGSCPVGVQLQDALAQRTTAFLLWFLSIPSAEDGGLEVRVLGIS